jgi:hypothetical protein
MSGIFFFFFLFRRVDIARPTNGSETTNGLNQSEAAKKIRGSVRAKFPVVQCFKRYLTF